MTALAEGSIGPALDDAERDLLAVVLWSGQLGEAATLSPTDFGNERHRTIWTAMLRLAGRNEAVDAASVAVELERRDDPAVRVSRADLVQLAGECALPAALPTYVRHVREAAERRCFREAGTRLLQAAGLGDLDSARQHAELARDLLAAHTATGGAAAVVTTDLLAFLDEPEDEHRDAVVPDVIERGERVIVTGGEGMGKSTWLRQIAVQVASGIHPFTLEPIDPMDALLIDLENPRRHLRRELRKVRLAAGDAYAPGRLIVESRPQGLDLLDSTDRAWLHNLVAATQPALIVTGPLYKLASGDPTEEKTARTVAQTLDDIRVSADAAVIIEAHVPHAANGQRQRPIRPYGASLWLRWPEFGINLGDDGAIRHWRGARDERDWPTALKRGGAWPWTTDDRSPADVANTELDDDQRKCLAAVIEAGTETPTAAVVESTGLHRSRASRALNALAERTPPLLNRYEPGPGKPVYYSPAEGV